MRHYSSLSINCFIYVYLVLTAFIPHARASDFSWQYSSYKDNTRNGSDTARLVYGVPETDNVKFEAKCSSGANLTPISVLMGYDPRHIHAGANATLEIMANGQSRSYAGTIHHPVHEEALGGILFSPALTDPFWDVLERSDMLSYHVNHQSTVYLALNGSGNAVRTFLKKCKTLTASKTHPIKTASGAISCKRGLQLRSRVSKTPVTVTFNNKSDGHRGVLWINFQGHPISYANLNPGQSYTVKTYLTHPWMITDGPGNCLEMFMPIRGVSQFNITAPNRYFGAE